MTGTEITVAPIANTPAKATVRTRRASKALDKAKALGTGVAVATPAKPKQGTSKRYGYAVTPLVLNQKKIAQALSLLKSGSKPARAAATMECTVGQYAFYCMLGGVTPVGGTVPNHGYQGNTPGAPQTPEALAKYVAGARKAGRSWGWLAAATRTSETTVRNAYEAATGQKHSDTGVGAWASRRA